MSALPDFATIEENLTFLEDWEDRYRYIIELGQSLPPLAEDLHNDATRVHGCTAQVWLNVIEQTSATDLRLTFEGDSDAMIVKGLVAIVIALYSGQSAADIAATDALQTFDRLNLREHLSTQRSNGLASMVARIRSEARARL